MLTAQLYDSNKLIKTGQIYTIQCADLDIEVSAKNPERALCREIVAQFPHLAEEALKIYRGDTHSSTIKNIYRFSKKTIKENDMCGLQEVLYRAPPSKAK